MTTAKTTAKIINACDRCGGTLGHLPHRGRHVLCDQRWWAGRPTPCIGHRCLPCDGAGVTTLFEGPSPLDGQRQGSGVFDSFVEVFLTSTPCQFCNGTGKAQASTLDGAIAISRWTEGFKCKALLTCTSSTVFEDLARHVLKHGTTDDVVWLLTVAKSAVAPAQ